MPPRRARGRAALGRADGPACAALNPQFGIEGPLTVARIDEAWCIGCTLCIKACPVDAILGANKFMHTVVAEHCTGCELCIPACPVDCIELDVVTPHASGWQAWSPQQAAQARQRYTQHQARLSAAAPTASATRTAHDEKSAKASAIAQALAKARALRQPRA